MLQASSIALCFLLLAGQVLGTEAKGAAALASHQGVAAAGHADGDVLGGISSANSSTAVQGEHKHHDRHGRGTHQRDGHRGSRRRHRRAAADASFQEAPQANLPAVNNEVLAANANNDNGAITVTETQTVYQTQTEWEHATSTVHHYVTVTPSTTGYAQNNYASRQASVSSAYPASAGVGSKLSSGSSKNSSSSSNSSSTSTQLSSSSFIEKGGVMLGMLPDFGYSGASDSFSELNSMVSSTGKKLSIFGEYAQVLKGEVFDGKQLMYRWDDVLGSGAIFEPAVMPTGGWDGFTWQDNHQAVAVCKVMQKFVDAGVPEVRLRFAHEANYYQTDGTYPGDASDFIEGFNVVAHACRSIAPKVKMFWTPNIASLAQYTAYQPDMSYVDYIGIDYYPKKGTDLSSSFVEQMKPFHDKYTNDNTHFAIGETGLGWGGTVSERMQWFKSVVEAKSSMPRLVSAAWFNYNKGYNYKLLDKSDSSATNTLVSYLKGWS